MKTSPQNRSEQSEHLLQRCFALGRHFLAILLASGTTSVALAGTTASDDLSPSQIFQKVQETYASIISYNDEGRVVITRDDNSAMTCFLFTMRLARPSFYLIEWNQACELSGNTGDSSIQVVWSHGEGDFLSTDPRVQLETNRESALIHAAAHCGGATATIPPMFFSGRWMGSEVQPDDFVSNGKRESDGNVGGLNCYVFSRGINGSTNTLWIGKEDFLIHQIRTVTSAEAVRAVAAGDSLVPELIGAVHGSTSTETHINIVLNRQFPPSGFMPFVSHFSDP